MLGGYDVDSNRGLVPLICRVDHYYLLQLLSFGRRGGGDLREANIITLWIKVLGVLADA